MSIIDGLLRCKSSMSELVLVKNMLIFNIARTRGKRMAEDVETPKGVL